MKLLLVTHDPGGANAVIPVALKLYNEEGIELLVYASSFSIPMWEKVNIPFISIEGDAVLTKIEQILIQEKPLVLFTGTSEFSALENNFWKIARKLSIPSYAILDHWTSYKERFVRNNEFGLPDFIFTMDESSKKALITNDIPEKSVIVTGQPHFEQFISYKSNISHELFCEQMELFQKPIITYVSDTLEISYGKNDNSEPTLGYDEKTTLHDLAEALHVLGSQFTKNFQLVIKLHPKESLDKYDLELQKPIYEGLGIRVIKQANNLDMLYHSHLVVGMFSMMVLEAFLMQTNTFFVQLNNKKVQRFGDFNIDVIETSQELHNQLKKYLNLQSDGLKSPTPITSSSSIIIKYLTGQTISN